MPLDLASNIYSTNTLVEGVHLVKKEEGMDTLNSTDAQLAEELAPAGGQCLRNQDSSFANIGWNEDPFCWKTS